MYSGAGVSSNQHVRGSTPPPLALKLAIIDKTKEVFAKLWFFFMDRVHKHLHLYEIVVAEIMNAPILIDLISGVI